MELRDINLTTKINKLETYIRHYNIYLYVLKKLYVQLNKDGSYPCNPYPKLSIEGAELEETNTRIYGYKWFKLKVCSRSFLICISKDYDNDIHITCKETTKGAQYDCGEFYIRKESLETQETFKECIDVLIARYEEYKDRDIEKIDAVKKVWKQLKKIDDCGLENYEVRELL